MSNGLQTSACLSQLASALKLSLNIEYSTVWWFQLRFIPKAVRDLCRRKYRHKDYTKSSERKTVRTFSGPQTHNFYCCWRGVVQTTTLTSWQTFHLIRLLTQTSKRNYFTIFWRISDHFWNLIVVIVSELFDQRDSEHLPSQVLRHSQFQSYPVSVSDIVILIA